MISVLRHSLPLVLIAGLAACGGTTVPLPSPGGGVANPGDNLLPDGGAGRLSLAEIATVSQRLAPGYNAAAVTPRYAVPVSGSAEYIGYVAGNMARPVGRSDVSGLMAVGVDFNQNRVGGTVGNLVTSTGSEIDGVLQLRNGVLNRTLNPGQVTVLGDVNGQLRDAAGRLINVNGAITNGNGQAGGFKGNDAQYLGIPMRGTTTEAAGTGSFALNGVLGRVSN